MAADEAKAEAKPEEVEEDAGGLDDDDETLTLKSGGQQPKSFEISKKCAELSKFVTTILEGMIIIYLMFIKSNIVIRNTISKHSPSFNPNWTTTTQWMFIKITNAKWMEFFLFVSITTLLEFVADNDIAKSLKYWQDSNCDLKEKKREKKKNVTSWSLGWFYHLNVLRITVRWIAVNFTYNDYNKNK